VDWFQKGHRDPNNVW
jgi:hypothetical protein